MIEVLPNTIVVIILQKIYQIIAYNVPNVHCIQSTPYICTILYVNYISKIIILLYRSFPNFIRK